MIRSQLLLIFSFLSFAQAQAQFQGNALDFDGTNDMVVISSVPSFFSSLGSSDFTIEAWVNPRGSAFQRIFFAQPATNNFVAFGTGVGNVIYFYVVVNGTTYSVATTGAITQNQWTHVAGRWTAATSSPQVFFNGVLQAGGAGGTSSTGTSGLMTLGTRPGGFQYFNGFMDEVRLWSEARTDCEITSNMNRSITGVQPNLVVNFDFNQGVAGGTNTGVTNLPDLSGNSYNGTLTNFALTGATSNWIASAATVATQGNPLGGYAYSQNWLICSGDSVTFPDGTTQTNITSQVVQNSTIPGPGGCDTTITTTVDVNPVYTYGDTAYICSGDSLSFPDGTSQANITVSFSQVSALNTANGCDSTITTWVEVAQPSSSADSMSICPGDSITFPDGNTVTNITSPMIYTSTIANAAGCDSSITTTVNINPAYAYNEFDTICSGENYTFPDGTLQTNITSNTVHTSFLNTLAGCDSIISTAILVITVDTSVSLSGTTLTASATGATYQWLDCDNAFAPVAGANGQSFTPAASGNFALALTENGCTDTSGCHNVTITSLTGTLPAGSVNIYPNPTNGLLNFDAGRFREGQVQVIDLAGVVVYEIRFNESAFSLDLSKLPAGVYLISVNTAEGRMLQRIIRE